MVDRRIRLLSPRGWRREGNEHSSPTCETPSPVSEESPLLPRLASPFRPASTTPRRKFLDKDPDERQPGTFEWTFAKDKGETSRCNGSTHFLPSFDIDLAVTADGTREPSMAATLGSSFSLDSTERKSAEPQARGFGASSPGSLDQRPHMSSDEQRENPRRCLVKETSSEEESMVSEKHFLLMRSSRERRNKERAPRVCNRKVDGTESDSDSTYGEHTESDEGQPSDKVRVPLIRVVDWDALMEKKIRSMPDQS